MEGQNDFYTWQSLGTFIGTTGATTIIANGFQRALNWNPAWLALLVAEIICIATVYYTHESNPALPSSDYFIAIINGFLVFGTAAGATAGANAAAGAQAVRAGAQVAPSARGFLTPWF